VAGVVTHADAPPESWSPLSPGREGEEAILRHAKESDDVLGACMLSTCSRTELYLEVRMPVDAGDVVRRLLTTTHATEAALRLVRVLEGEAVVRHLFRVASGLDSIALGEREIHGQVRDALSRSRHHHGAGILVPRLFESALATSARVRRESRWGIAPPSLAAVAASAMREVLVDPDTPVAVLGAGRTARTAAHRLRSLGVSRLHIVNRSLRSAQSLALAVRGSAHTLDALPTLLAGVGGVLAAATVRAPLVTPSQMPALTASPGRVLHLIDLGTPANVDPACAAFPHVVLHRLGDLDRRLDAMRRARREMVTEVELHVDREVQRFLAWWRHRRVVPLVQRLTAEADLGLRLAVDRAIRRARAAGSTARVEPEELRPLLHQFGEALLSRLLHRPLTALHIMARRDALPDDTSAEEALLVATTPVTTAPPFNGAP